MRDLGQYNKINYGLVLNLKQLELSTSEDYLQEISLSRIH